ncbi:MAG: hypothetical protein ACOC0F_01195 [archaeon]
MSTETPNPIEPDELADSTDSERAEEAVGDQSNPLEVEPWEDIGRTLLRVRLERVGEETVRDAFRQAISRISNGDELTEDDIGEMYHAIEDAKRAVELAAEASPETTPSPDLWEFLFEEDKRAYVEEVGRRRGY